MLLFVQVEQEKLEKKKHLDFLDTLLAAKVMWKKNRQNSDFVLEHLLSDLKAVSLT